MRPDFRTQKHTYGATHCTVRLRRLAPRFDHCAAAGLDSTVPLGVGLQEKHACLIEATVNVDMLGCRCSCIFNSRPMYVLTPLLMLSPTYLHTLPHTHAHILSRTRMHTSSALGSNSIAACMQCACTSKASWLPGCKLHCSGGFNRRLEAAGMCARDCFTCCPSRSGHCRRFWLHQIARVFRLAVEHLRVPASTARAHGEHCGCEDATRCRRGAACERGGRGWVVLVGERGEHPSRGRERLSAACGRASIGVHLRRCLQPTITQQPGDLRIRVSSIRPTAAGVSAS